MPEEEAEEEEEEAADGQEHCREANRPRHLILFKQLKRATLGAGGGASAAVPTPVRVRCCNRPRYVRVSHR